MKKEAVIVIIVILIFFTTSCAPSPEEPSVESVAVEPGTRADEVTSTESTSVPEEEASPTAEDQPAEERTTEDQCNNALGNGVEIVSGPTGPEGDDRDNPFRSLTVHPTDENILYLGTERNGILKSSDGGQTWERLRYGLRHDPSGYPEIYDMAIAGNNPTVLYAVATSGGPGPLIGDYPSAGGGIYKSIDGGTTWQRKNCGLPSGWVWSVWVDPADENHVITGVSGGEVSFWGQGIEQGTVFPGGIFYSYDGGESWKKATFPDESKNFAFPRISGQGTLYTSNFHPYEAGGMGFLKSEDQGKIWEQVSSTIIYDFSLTATKMYAIGEKGIISSDDGGKTWKTFTIPTSVYAIAAPPDNEQRVLYATSHELFLSTNGLSSDSRVLQHDGEGHFAEIVFAPSNSNIVYAVTLGYILYQSTDGGSRWQKLKDIRREVLNAN